MSPFQILNKLVSLKKVTSFATITLISLNLLITPSFAGDPFRKSQPRKIGDRTEAAFNAMFLQGNYPAAADYLQQAIDNESNEPLAYALQASLAYGKNDLPELRKYGRKTLLAGQRLIANDSLRGNLYTGVGHFLEGAVIILEDSSFNGVSKGLNKLSKVYEYLDKAEAINANDPELNLIRGYMNLLLAVHIPFVNLNQAVNKLEQNAAPKYLVDRGIALAYRDSEQYSQALSYVNRALKNSGENPEIYYLKAQILHEKGHREKSQKLLKDAIANFEKALTKKSQLPKDLVKQIEYELNIAKTRANRI
jgi:tetratricopeptide (TPR) repeat protein